MAAWQTSFHVIPSAQLPADYRERLSSLLPPGLHWDSVTERWGLEDGDLVDVSADTPEVLARFDLRNWRPDLYAGFLTFVEEIGGTIFEAEGGAEVPRSIEAFSSSLLTSRAARFVRNPEAYFEELRANPIKRPGEP